MSSIPPADPHSYRLSVLRDGVERLADDAEGQLRRIGKGHPDELALAFDDGYRLLGALQSEGVRFQPAFLSLLAEINGYLERMSRDPQFWTTSTMLSDAVWHELRGLAAKAATLLPSETP